MAAFKGDPKDGFGGRSSLRRYGLGAIIQPIEHDHQEIVKRNALQDKNKANDNLREMGVYLKMGEEHDEFALDGAKYTSSLRSQMIESKIPAWGSYLCTYFGQAPLLRYPKPSTLTFERMKFLHIVNNAIVGYIMHCINSKIKIPSENREEWMLALCKQTNPVLAYIPKVEEFTNAIYPSLIFEAYAFEIPHEDNAKIYIVLTTNTELDGYYLVTDYFFYYF